MRKIFEVFTLLYCSIFICQAQPELSLEEFASGFERPVVIAHAGDERLFIVEQRGEIWELDENGEKSAMVFLDIKEKVNREGNEQGLLGLSFSPNFTNDLTFYVYYTGGTSNGFSVIARYKVDPVTNKADKDSEEILITFSQPFANHNAGDMHFGKDGYLYISTGDGGGAGDLQNNAQNKSKFLGKILRIDVDTVASYRIPKDNPFINEVSVLDEIWALGLRNPWRFSFDRFNGDMWIADVGQSAFEEINYLSYPLASGVNFGWRCYEASNNFILLGCGPKDDYHFPIFKYGRSEGFSVTGGFVYRGKDQRYFDGNYIMADYIFGNFWIISPKGNTIYVNQYDNFLRDVTAFGEDKRGELFVAELVDGKIYKIIADCPDTSISAPQIAYNASLNQLTVEVADDKHNNFQWYLNDTIIHGANSPSYTPLVSGNYKLEVTYNNKGCLYRSEANLTNVVVGISEQKFDAAFKIYPNPSSNYFFLEATEPIMSVRLYTTTGNELQPNVTKNDNLTAEVNLNEYSRGIYIVSIELRTGTFYRRLIKY